MKKQSQAYLFALSAILFWSTMSSAFKITLRFIDYTLLLLYASLFSLFILFIILVLQKKINLLKDLKLKDFISSAIMGFLNPFLYYFILFKAYTLLRAQEAGTLNYIWPIVLVLFSVPLLKQKIGFKSIIAIVISFFGIIIISTEGHVLTLQFSNIIGVGLAAGSAIFWALYWIFNMKDKRDDIIKLFLNFCFGFIYILVTCLIIDGIQLPSQNALVGSIYIGFFEMGITYFLWLKALSLSINTAKVSNLVYLSPFLALIFISIIVGEKILASTIVGLFFIVGGILMQKYIDAKPTKILK
ncbi:MAG: EamA family transporter [Bacteroidetes bacterium HGW-Bacteroidetes-17]|jgi:drug/metabolite transporter (DMT)-like permease|nr:MAG: EamA family transporter [Bacteroidetes bacterium HGW-Bacteroidetes-17]